MSSSMTDTTTPDAIAQTGDDDDINLAFVHPDRCYVEACADSLNIPDWQPNREVWSDLCEVALRLTATTPRLAAHGAGEGLREALEYALPLVKADIDDAMRVRRANRYVIEELERHERTLKALLTPPTDAGSTTREGGVGVLKRCPFCGGEATQPYFGEAVKCADCSGGATTFIEWQRRVDFSATPTDPAPSSSFIRRAALVEYAMHYGPRCRECADHGDVCPMSGMACGERRKATEFVVDALIYGATHGYCPAALATPPSPDASPDSGEAFVRAAIRDWQVHDVNVPHWFGSVHVDRLVQRLARLSPSPAIVKEAGEVGHVRELLAEAYKDLSGRDLHASDCATSLAPAYTPGPCDCYPRVLFLNWPAEKIDEPVGWKGENPPTPDHFQCEFCGESNLDCTLIPHRQNCPVTSARAALSASNAAQVSK